MNTGAVLRGVNMSRERQIKLFIRAIKKIEEKSQQNIQGEKYI